VDRNPHRCVLTNTAPAVAIISSGNTEINKLGLGAGGKSTERLSEEVRSPENCEPATSCRFMLSSAVGASRAIACTRPRAAIGEVAVDYCDSNRLGHLLSLTGSWRICIRRSTVGLAVSILGRARLIEYSSG
jgi:hypothetical protein